MASVERHSQFPLLLQAFNLGANVLHAVEVAHAASHGETRVLDRRLRGHDRAGARWHKCSMTERSYRVRIMASRCNGCLMPAKAGRRELQRVPARTRIALCGVRRWLSGGLKQKREPKRDFL